MARRNFRLAALDGSQQGQLDRAGDCLAQLREGAIVVSFTTPVANSDFEILVKDTCEVSWGQAVYVQRSHTEEAQRRKSRDDEEGRL